MKDDEIKLTTSNNTTSSGDPFPTTPKPEILMEYFASYELKNPNTTDSEEE